MFQVRRVIIPLRWGTDLIRMAHEMLSESGAPLGIFQSFSVFAFSVGCNLHMLLGSIGLTPSCDLVPHNIRKALFFCPPSRLIIFQSLSRAALTYWPQFSDRSTASRWWAEHSVQWSQQEPPLVPARVHHQSHKAVPWVTPLGVSSVIHKHTGCFWWKCLICFLNALTSRCICSHLAIHYMMCQASQVIQWVLNE